MFQNVNNLSIIWRQNNVGCLQILIYECIFDSHNNKYSNRLIKSQAMSDRENNCQKKREYEQGQVTDQSEEAQSPALDVAHPPRKSQRLRQKALKDEKKVHHGNLSHQSRNLPSKSSNKKVEQGIHLYSIEGQTKVRHVSEPILKQKLASVVFSITQPTIEVNEEQPKEPSQDDAQHDGYTNYTLKHRYFRDVLKKPANRKVFRCYRCGKEGHTSKQCLEDKNKIKCYYCLKSHHCNMCQSSVFCNRCGEADHIQYECDTKIILKCERCKRNGHLKQSCGTIIFEKGRKNQILSFKQYDLTKVDKGDLENLKCLNKCSQQFSHFSCYEHDGSKATPYKDYEKGNKQQSEQKTLEQKIIENEHI